MEGVAVDLGEGLLALAVGAGLQVMQAMFEADVTAVAGPRSKRDRERTAVRHGCGPGSVTLGGRRMPVSRPWVRSADGSAELPVPSCELFSSHRGAGPDGLERMLGGLSTCRHGLGLQPVGEQVSETATSTSKSAVSRRFVAATETALAELLARPLHEVDPVALSGARHRRRRVKHPVALVEGSTENTTVVCGLLVGLRERGLDTTRPVLVVIDGAKALAKAVHEVFDQPVIQRCQLHKIRNVRDHLPERLRGPVESRMRRAYHADPALDAQAQLEELAKGLAKTHPGAAASLREALPETLTTLRLDVPPTLARTLRSTNTIESMTSICREHAKNVQAPAARDDGAALVRRGHA